MEPVGLQKTKRSAVDYIPSTHDYRSLKRAVNSCHGCEIYQNATQAVFGEGLLEAEVMFVGEQPGDEEDRRGHPFVGPAGRLFNKALIEADIDRQITYVTNVVKHFKWKRGSGKRRLHERPRASEVKACLPWLNEELEIVRPRILILLGATAAQALLGNAFRITRSRGLWLESALAERVLATVHPSSILRAPDAASREEQYRAFVADLKIVAGEMRQVSGEKLSGESHGSAKNLEMTSSNLLNS